MHRLVLRRTLQSANRGLVRTLMDGFKRSLGLALHDLRGRDYPKIAAPGLAAHKARSGVAFGGEPWTYGVDRNIAAIDALLAYVHADGLTPERLKASDVFAAID